MKYSEEYRDKALVEEICARIAAKEHPPITIMEVCGTHTMSIARFGIKSLLPPDVKLISGPGCPVCVTDQYDIDSFLALGEVPGMILTSFGDMLRVPGSSTSLERLRAVGADVRVVYSPMDAVDIARENPDRQVVFFGIGFETTIPAVALAITTAASENVGNFAVYCVHKTIPAALKALLSADDVKVTGMLLPGHVTTIIGVEAYNFLQSELKVPCAVTGFEPVDVMLGIESIVNQVSEGGARVDNVYRRAVREFANPRAAALIADVFTPSDAAWRGIGVIPGSGLRISDKYSAFDAQAKFTHILAKVPPAVKTDCRCGDVLRGVIAPCECPFFGLACTPTDPIGPCMVSSEGACAASYSYGGYNDAR